MSESSENTSTTPGVDTSASAPVDTGASVTNEAPAQEAAPKEDDSYFPNKYRNADGTPNVKNLAKAYDNLQKKLGARPNVGASSVEEYAYDFGEDFDYDEARGNAFREAALAKGLSADQYQFVMETYKQSVEANTWTHDKAEAALKQAWGDDFAENTKAAGRAFGLYAPSNISSHDPRLNDPFVMELLANIGREIREDSVAGKTGGSTVNQTIREQIDALRADPDYWANPDKQKRMEALYSKLK